jgi:uncharacterized protein YbaR (Trm112 family)/SAM-dependent methyltransferase
MGSFVKLSEWARKLLCCPVCHADLQESGARFLCVNRECGACFPVVEGIPVLINENSSLFTIDDFTSGGQTAVSRRYRDNARWSLEQQLPSISANIKAKENYEQLAALLLKRSASPKVLVVGGRILGEGMEPLAQNRAIELVESDVAFGPRTKLICDSHDIPFKEQSFDAVLIQAVLEHVIDPYRCVAEIHRVLQENGLVYAETPFMQQVHEGRYDFTRFTQLGHRRLFRHFAEIESGATCGPGMALAWAYRYFLWSFTSSQKLRRLLMIVASITSFYLKYFDHFLVNKPGGLDAASGFYFLGQKSREVLSDRELIKLYRGAF